MHSIYWDVFVHKLHLITMLSPPSPPPPDTNHTLNPISLYWISSIQLLHISLPDSQKGEESERALGPPQELVESPAQALLQVLWAMGAPALSIELSQKHWLPNSVPAYL